MFNMKSFFLCIGFATSGLAMAAAAQAQTLPTTPGSPSYTVDFTLSGSGGNGTAVFWRQQLSDGKTYLLGRFSPRPSGRPYLDMLLCPGDYKYVYDGTVENLYAYTGIPNNGNDASCATLAAARTYAFADHPNPIPGWTVDKAFTVKVGTKGSVVINAADSPGGSGATTYNYSDAWYVPGNPGWGLQLTHHVDSGGTLFATFYVYDEAGKPKWYMIAGGSWSGNAYTGQIQEVTGPFGGIAALANFDSSQVRGTVVGNASLEFTSQNSATLNYTISGISGSKNIDRLIF